MQKLQAGSHTHRHLAVMPVARATTLPNAKPKQLGVGTHAKLPVHPQLGNPIGVAKQAGGRGCKRVGERVGGARGTPRATKFPPSTRGDSRKAKFFFSKSETQISKNVVRESGDDSRKAPCGNFSLLRALPRDFPL